MEFPMTRERLQTLAKEFEEARIQETIDDTVEFVKTMIIGKAYLDSPEKTNRGILGSPKFLNGQGQTSKRMLKLNLPLHCNSTYLPPKVPRTFINEYNVYNTTPYLPEIISRLQALFPDVSFQVDPLKTYLLVDWS